ncbi:DUF7017 domain-containing protein [Alishewanella sp. HL-SH05]|uniref:DUF7017 domain-containing protein n=1 Tax=Alishewanella sp. HL-SH05 TaxID=3461145 RepID=UPI004041C55D
MVTSKGVFEKRKEGNLDEAYSMALQLMNSQSPDEWDIKAFGWCLIDLIKREAHSDNPQYLNHYKQQLESITGSALDEALSKGKNYALSICNPNASRISKASQLSKNGQYDQSIAIYKQLIDSGETSPSVVTSLAWDLYKRSKELLTQSPVIYGKIKQYLKWYLMLTVDKPSILHSLILQIANKCASETNFDMLAFSRYWGLENLREEDFVPFKTNDGTTILSLAERVFIQAAKAGISKQNTSEMKQFLPILEKAISRLPDSIWLIQKKVQILISIGRADDARMSAEIVVKEKSREFWAWELLGDVYSLNDDTTAFSCYCKALICNEDVNFTSKVRLKLISRLIKNERFAEAKLEVNTIKSYRESVGQKVPDEVIKHSLTQWYMQTDATVSNKSMYNEHARQADELLYFNLPWLPTKLGQRFSTKDNPGKFKRELFVLTKEKCIQTNVPNKLFDFDKLSVGCELKVKGEFDSEGRFNVYTLMTNDSGSLLQFIPERIGLIDHINRNKGVLHFIVDKTCEGVIKLDHNCSNYNAGDSIALKLAERTSKQGRRYTVLSHKTSNKEPSEDVMQHFSESVRVNNGMGFTLSGIFIPPPILKKYNINDNDSVTGRAVINFNDKRGVWGWRAFDIKLEQKSGEELN